MISETPLISRQIRLSDGRALAYAEHGEPSGEPVFFFHGTPGSRLFHHPDGSIATTLGARVITIDRPGVGLSDFKPDRTLLDWPDDVAELADALHIERFAVAGISGGGPYVAACALRMPHRLTAAAMISSVGPLETPDATNGMIWYLRLLFSLARHSRTLAALSWWLANVAGIHNSEWLRNLEVDGLPRSERELLDKPDVRRMLAEDYAEAVRCGVSGVAWDLAVLARPWGCRLEDIATVVHLWHGDEDVRTTPTMARYLASVIPGCRAVFFPGEGHDVFYNHWRQILATLLSYRTTEENARLWWQNDKPSDKRLTRHALASRCAMSERWLSTKQPEACEAGQQRQRIGMDIRQ